MGLNVFGRATQCAHHACNDEFLHSAIQVSRTQINELDPFFKSSHVFPIGLRENRMQPKSKTASIVHLLRHFLLFAVDLCVVIRARCMPAHRPGAGNASVGIIFGIAFQCKLYSRRHLRGERSAPSLQRVISCHDTCPLTYKFDDVNYLFFCCAGCYRSANVRMYDFRWAAQRGDYPYYDKFLLPAIDVTFAEVNERYPFFKFLSKLPVGFGQYFFGAKSESTMLQYAFP